MFEYSDVYSVLPSENNCSCTQLEAADGSVVLRFQIFLAGLCSILLSYAFSEKLVYKYLLLTHLHHKRKFHIFCISPNICSGIPHLSFILSIVLASFKTKQTQVCYLSLFCFNGVQIVLNKEADKCKNLLAVVDYGTICACVCEYICIITSFVYAYIF